MQRPLWGVVVLALAACSGSGTVYGDISVTMASGEVRRAARIDVMAIAASEAFKREWGTMLAAFRVESDAAREVEKAAAFSADQTRLAWDKALAARLAARSAQEGRGRRPVRGHAQELWRQVRAMDEALFRARRAVWEVARKHEVTALALLGRYRSQVVQTDAEGHYVFARLPAGTAYVYARVPMEGEDLVWFQPVQVRRGVHRMDLTRQNKGGWPFVP